MSALCVRVRPLCENAQLTAPQVDVGGIEWSFSGVVQHLTLSSLYVFLELNVGWWLNPGDARYAGIGLCGSLLLDAGDTKSGDE